MTDHETAAHRHPGQSRPAVDFYFALIAFGLAWAVSAYRVGPSGSWETDYRVAQCASDHAIGWDGIPAAMLARAFRLLPIGMETTRLGMVSAAACAIASLFVYRLTYHALSATSGGGLVQAWLSLGTACLFALSPSAQLAASAPPGPFVAVALTLATSYASLADWKNSSTISRHFSGTFVLGLLVAITTLERAWAGAVALFTVVLVAQSVRVKHESKDLREGLIGLFSGIIALGLPWLVTRRIAQSQSLLGADLFAHTHVPFASRWTDLRGNLMLDLGPIVLFFCALGVIGWLLEQKRRQSLWLLGLVLPYVLIVFLWNHRTADADANSGLQLLFDVGLLIVSAYGFRHIIAWLGRGQASRTALVSSLAVIGQTTIALAHGDEAGYRADRFRTAGTEIFADEALLELPARSVVVLRHAALYRRFSAATRTLGMRPDLVLLSLEAATRPSVVNDLVQREPALSAVLRDLAITGHPSEFALSSLADARPVYLEFDPEWDQRLREHLLPLPLLSRLTSQALGRSERAEFVAQSQQQVIRLFRSTLLPGANAGEEGSVAPLEETTRFVFRSRVREYLTLLLSLGDRQAFDALFADYEDFEPNCPWAIALKSRLRNTNRPISAFDLLAPPLEHAVQTGQRAQAN